MRRTLLTTILLASTASIPAAHAQVTLAPSCPTSAAFFARASTNIAAALAADTPGVLTWETAVDTLVCGQATAGTLATKDVEYLTVAPTLALAEMNLVSAFFPLSAGASMAFAPNAGLTGAATSTGSADTGYTPSSGQMTPSSATLGVCVLNPRTTLMTNSFLSEVGTGVSGNDFVLDILTAGAPGQASLFMAGGPGPVGPSSTAVSSTLGGFWASRTSSAGITAYVNGASIGTENSTAPALAGIGDFFVLGSPTAGLPDTIGGVVMGAGETSAQISADNALLNNALHSMGVSGCDGLPGPGVVGGGSPPPVVLAPANTLIPQIVGTDFPASPATTVTLTADPGRWDNTPTSFTYNWHSVSGASLGTGATITLNTATAGVIGSAPEVDVTATNAGGSTTVTSHWFGPLEASAPVAPVARELSLPPTGPQPLPVSPANFLQNGHAIFPGCSIPPAVPNTDPAHVWYFDPINGTTQSAQTTAGVPTASQGHAGHPFKDAFAIFNAATGYSAQLFGGLIPRGDTIYLEPGNAANPIGDLASNTPTYSTSDGTTSGAIKWTWIMADPAAASRPVLHHVGFQNGSAGFVVKSLNVEQYREDNNQLVSVGGGDNHDLAFEDMRVDQWIGHSNDPWLPSHYPNSGGSSDGTILTATPTFAYGVEDATRTVATASLSDPTHITMSSTPPAFLVGMYVWPANYYAGPFGVVIPGASGIPNGSKVTAINGNVVTIAPCDPVADHATGCPSASYPGLSGTGHDNVPGCDPLTTSKNTTPVLSTFGGCPSGPVPAWNGVTRALNAETLQYTTAMTIVPAGYWNHEDFEGAGANGFVITGSLDRVHSVDLANPNLLTGATCMSMKDNIVRNGYNGFRMANVTNSMLYHNKVKWMSDDGFEGAETHRVVWADNYYSEPTVLWGHQDAIQITDADGEVAATYYGNAVIENEFYAQTDATNFFPRPLAGVNNTENTHDFMYVADNIIDVASSTAGISALGHYDVVVNNTVLGLVTQVGHQRKGSDTSPTYSVLANNVGNGVSRDNGIPNYCDPVAGDMDIVEGNVSIPFLNAGASSVYCTTGNVSNSGATLGAYPGLKTWTATDWRSGQAGVSSLFMAYQPPALPVEPQPGWIAPAGTALLASGVNLRPNPAFAGFTPPIFTTIQGSAILNLPTTQPPGTYAITQTNGFTGNLSYPLGLWQYCPTSGASGCPSFGTNPYVSANGWFFVGLPYNPGIIGAGTSLGAQQPIADHDGKAWANPPSIGAYQ